ANADITIRRQASSLIPEGIVYNGALYAAGGDFNGDGKADLVVGEPVRTLTAAGSNTILELDERGTAFVLFSIAERGSGVSLEDADSVIRGEAEFDRVGTLPAMPNVDINHDGRDDLLLGAEDADRLTTTLTPGAGKVYVMYGASTPPSLPPGDQIFELDNF